MKNKVKDEELKMDQLKMKNKAYKSKNEYIKPFLPHENFPKFSSFTKIFREFRPAFFRENIQLKF